MRDNLLGHLLNALDASEREELEARLNGDAELRDELEMLSRGLEVLEHDVRHFEPPPRLAERTCTFIRTQSPTVSLPPAAPARWGLQDLLVAAAVLVAASVLFFPAVANSRYYAQRAGCENNLRNVGVALTQYSDRNNDFFPVVPVEGKLAAAGIYGPALKEGGFIDGDHTLVCPASELREDSEFEVPTRDDLLAASGAQLKRLLRYAGGSYGYGLGYVEDGRYQGNRNRGRATYAIMSDQPCLVRQDHKSPNHGHCGQNVLFEDGHVSYMTTCRILGGGDDLFLNDQGEMAVGLHSNDSVIVPSDFRPVMPVSFQR